jgi:taurine transport system substrate-binding protein
MPCSQKPEESARILLELTSLSMEEQLGVIKQTEWFTGRPEGIDE